MDAQAVENDGRAPSKVNSEALFMGVRFFFEASMDFVLVGIEAVAEASTFIKHVSRRGKHHIR